MQDIIFGSNGILPHIYRLTFRLIYCWIWCRAYILTSHTKRQTRIHDLLSKRHRTQSHPHRKTSLHPWNIAKKEGLLYIFSRRRDNTIFCFEYIYSASFPSLHHHSKLSCRTMPVLYKNKIHNNFAWPYMSHANKFICHYFQFIFYNSIKKQSIHKVIVHSFELNPLQSFLQSIHILYELLKILIL